MVRKVSLVDCLKQPKRWPSLSEMEMLELPWCIQYSKGPKTYRYWSIGVERPACPPWGHSARVSYPTAVRHLQEEPGVLESAGHCSLYVRKITAGIAALNWYP